jgi:hypothetical protein
LERAALKPEIQNVSVNVKMILHSKIEEKNQRHEGRHFIPFVSILRLPFVL